MKYVKAAKQVGPISYYTDNIYALVNIISEGLIHPTTETIRKKEIYYTSFSRDMTIQPRRKPDKWKYGIVLDGDKLSNRYSFKPINDGYTEMSLGTMKVKYVTLYDDNTARLCIAHRGTFDISSSLYNALKAEMRKLPETELIKLGYYELGEGKPYGGKRRVEQAGFHAKNGGLKLSDNLPDYLQAKLLKSDAFYEREERIALESPKNINISVCLLGVYLPRNFPNPNSPADVKIYNELEDVLDAQPGSTFIRKY